MSILEKINFRQPKYMLPAILYLPLLGASYFIFDLFRTEKAEVQDTTLQTTEFLNPELPEATLKNGDGIGSKYENMTKSWGRIQDYTAVDNIERDEPDENKEEYESKYTDDDIALLGELEQEKSMAAEAADAKKREGYHSRFYHQMIREKYRHKEVCIDIGYHNSQLAPVGTA